MWIIYPSLLFSPDMFQFMECLWEMWKIMPNSLPTDSINIVLLIFHYHENFSSVMIKIKVKVQYMLCKDRACSHMLLFFKRKRLYVSLCSHKCERPLEGHIGIRSVIPLRKGTLHNTDIIFNKFRINFLNFIILKKNF